MRRWGLAGETIGFMVAAALGRSLLRHTESRWQIAAFVLAAVMLEAVRPEARVGLRLGRPLLLGLAAAIGVLAVKMYLEPQELPRTTLALRLRVVGAVRAVASGA